MSQAETNCIGYAYSELGLISKEIFLKCPYLDEILSHFDRVGNIKSADAAIVVVPYEGRYEVTHIAVVNHDKRTIRHRKGQDAPVNRGKIKGELRDYLREYEAEMVYLRLKSKK